LCGLAAITQNFNAKITIVFGHPIRTKRCLHAKLMNGVLAIDALLLAPEFRMLKQLAQTVPKPGGRTGCCDTTAFVAKNVAYTFTWSDREYYYILGMVSNTC